MPESNSRRIAKNTTFLYMRMLVVMLINIFSVRYVLKGLGVIDYGVFNVVAGLVTMFSSLSSILSSATLRFHSFAIGEGKEEKVSDVFSASFNIFGLLALIIFILGEILGVWFINTQADIPDERMIAANWVFQFTMLTFVMGLLTSPFSSLIFAYERMTVFSIISISECVLKFLLAYSLIYISSDHLILYGLGLLIIQFAYISAYYLASKYGGGEYHYKRNVDKSLYKQMLSFSGWTLFSSSAGVGISQLVTMITNVYFGPIVNAARAIAFQINNAMGSFTSNIVLAIKPPMIKTYADGSYEKVNIFFDFSNKAIFYSLIIFLLPIFVEIEIVLHIWLDVSDEQTFLFCRLVLVYALVVALSNPIAIIIQATGKIKKYSILAEIPTLLCFPVTWFLFAVGCQAQTAFYTMIVAIICSHYIRLICLKSLFPVFSYKRYLFRFMMPACLVLLITTIMLFTVRMILDPSVWRLLMSFIVSCVTVVVLCFLFGLNKVERGIIQSLIIKRVR